MFGWRQGWYVLNVLSHHLFIKILNVEQWSSALQTSLVADTRGLTSGTILVIHIYLSSIVKQATLITYIMLESVPRTIPVLNNEGQVSCSMKQREPLIGL